MLSLVCMGLTIAQVSYGAGRHQQFLSADASVSMVLKINFIAQGVFLWAPCFVKLSISLFLLQVTPKLFLKRLIKIAICIVFVWTAAGFAAILAQCKHLEVLWSPPTSTTCWPLEVIYALVWTNAGTYARTHEHGPTVFYSDMVNLTAVTISSDFFLAFIPIAVLWNVQMNKVRKWSLAGVMSLGVL